ncbi:hypothetical protein Vafri_7470, partial [Volvox africanus]
MNCQSDTWGAKMLRLLTILGCDLGDLSAITDIEEKVDTLIAYKLDTSNLMEELRSRMRVDWMSDRITVSPRVFVSDGHQPGIKMCRYVHWMGDPNHMEGYIPHTHHTSLIRFWLCCWAIEVNRPKGRARAVRHCPMCEREATEDEYHVLMECSAYEGLRQEIRQAGDFLEGNMAAVMSMGNQRRLAKVLHEIRRVR